MKRTNKRTTATVTPPLKKNKPTFSKGVSSRGGLINERRRFAFIWGITLIGFCTLTTRALNIQLLNNDFYQTKQQEKDMITSERIKPAYRGMIKDRNGVPLAVSAPLKTVYFSPHDYIRAYYNNKRTEKKYPNNQKKLDDVAKKRARMDLEALALLTNKPLDTFTKRIKIDEHLDVLNAKTVKAALPNDHYIPLMIDVSPEEAETLLQHNFLAVYSDTFYKRYYPEAQPNAQLIGFMGENETDTSSKRKLRYKGQAGIEKQFQTELAGQDGRVLVLKDGTQYSLKELKDLVPEVPGKDITLSVDARLQYILYRELERAGRLQQASSASGIVVDVYTGEVLAMTSWPSYNANHITTDSAINRRNRVVADVFEPGSVMKPFTVAAALESGEYNLYSTIDTSPGSLKINGHTIRDHGNLGIIDLTTLLKKSSNVASAKIGLKLPAATVANMQLKFGFGKTTKLNFPSELAGKVNIPTSGQIARRATITYGYGMQTNLAQLAQGFATLATHGVRHPLTLLKQSEPKQNLPIIKAQTADAIVGMLQTVTEKGGTGEAAAIDGYTVAGKTGTARMNNPDGGYYTNRYRASFVGIAPASNPKLVAAIMLEDPKDHYGGAAAAPVFKQVMQEALRLNNVPLDKPLISQP